MQQQLLPGIGSQFFVECFIALGSFSNFTQHGGGTFTTGACNSLGNILHQPACITSLVQYFGCRWRLSDMLDFFRLLFPPYQTSQLVQVAFLAPTTNAGGSEGVTRRASKMCQAAAAARHELHRTCNVIWRGISRYETGSDSSTIKCL